MDKELFVQNVKNICDAKGVSTTMACRESGVGSTLITNLKNRGVVPSVEKIEQLAAYLGTTVSELIGEVGPGETKKPTPTDGDGLTEADCELLGYFEELNDEGQGVLLGVAKSMVLSGQYIKAGQDRVDKKA